MQRGLQSAQVKSSESVLREGSCSARHAGFRTFRHRTAERPPEAATLVAAQQVWLGRPDLLAAACASPGT